MLLLTLVTTVACITSGEAVMRRIQLTEKLR